jgi:tripartite-type tricarboxylate transporter receptor subunit TctC
MRQKVRIVRAPAARSNRGSPADPPRAMTDRLALPRRTVLAAALAAACLPAARAQTADASPVRLVVPFTPGTGIDLIARLVAPQLAERYGRPFVVDNRTGASGNIGTQEVVRAAPDGGTLLVSVNTLVMNRALYPNLPFDPLRDLEPVALTSWGQLVLVVHPGTGIETLPQLVARAKAKPGSLNYASPGAGTPHHLAMELLKNTARISLVHIPYRGTAPAVTDLLGGQVEAMFLPIHVAQQHVKSGRLRALAISSDAPSPILPSVPPLRSLGMGNLNVDMWYGVLAPKNTPRAVVERLNRELRDILAQPATATAFETQGMTPAHGTPEAFQKILEADARRWAELIKAQGITAQ